MYVTLQSLTYFEH